MSSKSGMLDKRKTERLLKTAMRSSDTHELISILYKLHGGFLHPLTIFSASGCIRHHTLLRKMLLDTILVPVQHDLHSFFSTNKKHAASIPMNPQEAPWTMTSDTPTNIVEARKMLLKHHIYVPSYYFNTESGRPHEQVDEIVFA